MLRQAQHDSFKEFSSFVGVIPSEVEESRSGQHAVKR